MTAFKGAVWDFFTISSLRRELTLTRTLQWPGHNRVQITYNTSSAYMQHVVCPLVRRDSSAINSQCPTPHHSTLCGCEVKDVHGLHSFVLTHSEEGDSVLFILCLQQQMLLASALTKQHSVISLQEWVLVLELFTTATRKLRFKFDSVEIAFILALFYWPEPLTDAMWPTMTELVIRHS